MFAEDLKVFFNTAEFADSATLAGADVVGIFDKACVVSGAGLGFASSRPAMTLPTDVIGVSPVGKDLVHDSVSYKVAAIDPDRSNRSITVLLLELA